MTCRVEEKDKLAREGSEKRRIMGLKRESLIFTLVVGALLNGYQERQGGKKRHDHQIAALHAPHIEEEFSHTWTNKDTHSRHRGRVKCLYAVDTKHNTPYWSVWFFSCKKVSFTCA